MTCPPSATPGAASPLSPLRRHASDGAADLVCHVSAVLTTDEVAAADLHASHTLVTSLGTLISRQQGTRGDCIRSTMAVVISALRNDYLVDGWSTGKSSTTLRKTLVAKSC
jgi:hypothetical protein